MARWGAHVGSVWVSRAGEHTGFFLEKQRPLVRICIVIFSLLGAIVLVTRQEPRTSFHVPGQGEPTINVKPYASAP